MLPLGLTLALLGIAFKAEAFAACWQLNRSPHCSATILSGSALKVKVGFGRITSRQMAVRSSDNVGSYSLLPTINQLCEPLHRGRCAATLTELVNGCSERVWTAAVSCLAVAGLNLRKTVRSPNDRCHNSFKGRNSPHAFKQFAVMVHLIDRCEPAHE